MKFCPKCGGFLTPYKKENEIVLKCTKCGYEVQQQSARYTLAVQQPSKIFTTSIVSEEKKSSRKKEEIEQEREEYYKELFMELLREEEYGEET